jgi:hypothetical protein
MNLAMLHNVNEEAKSSKQISRLESELRDAKDDLKLRETLLKNSKENVNLLES